MKLKLYLTISYVKYIVLILLSFLLIIWLAQIIRYLDLSESFDMQFSQVAIVTIYLLPNAISTILPIIIFIATCFFNYQLNQTNEISIFSLYLSKISLRKIILFTYSILLTIYAFNTEIISVDAYNKYKLKEIELRNKLKIKDFKNEIYIKNKLNLFYESRSSDNSILVNAVTYLISENVVIKSKEVSYSQSNNELLFTFLKGSRIASSENEKSFTNFDKLEYRIVNNFTNKISLDKENYNFYSLIKNKNKLYQKSAHKRIIDLIMLIFIFYISSRVILINDKSKILITNYSINLLIILVIFTFIAFMTNIFISETINIYFYYFGIISIILLTIYLLSKKYDTL
jgi:lipopolysaccharide export LptBFGC system permease protein LptF